MGTLGKIAVATTVATLFVWNSWSCASTIAQSWTTVPPLIKNGGYGHQFVLDLDRDGHDEVVLVGRPDQAPYFAALAVLGGMPAPAQGLQRIYSRIDVYAGQFFRIDDAGGFSGPSILEVGALATQVLRGKSLAVAATFPPPPSDYLVRAAGDLAGDGSLQVVGVSYGQLDVRDVRNWEVLHSLSGGFGNVSLTQLDADPALEIVIEGRPLLVIDAGTLAVEWTYPNGGREVSVGSARNDAGRFVFKAYTDEAYEYDIVAVDANPPRIAWTIPAPEPIVPDYRYQLADVDGDGRSELLRWKNFGHEIDVLDATTLQQRFVLDGSVTDSVYMAAHLSDAPYNTLVSVTNSSHINPQSDISAIAGTIGSVEQLQPAEGPSFSRLAVGDVDGDGRDEIVVASTASDGKDVIRFLDRASGKEEALMRIEHNAGGDVFWPVQAIAVARTNAAQPPKIFVDNEHSILVIDGVSRQALYSLASRNPALDYIGVSTLRTADLDGDGNEELLVGGIQDFFVVDPFTSLIKWSVPLGQVVADVQTMPAGDGVHKDVLVFTSAHVYRFASTDHSLRWAHSFYRGGGFDPVVGTYVAHGMAGAEVAVVLSGPGVLEMLDAETGAYLRGWDANSGLSLSGVSFLAAPSGDIDRLVTNGGAWGLTIIDGATATESGWPPPESIPIGPYAGQGNNVVITADPVSGRHSFIIGSHGGVSSLYVTDRDVIFDSGFERAAAVVQP